MSGERTGRERKLLFQRPEWDAVGASAPGAKRDWDAIIGAGERQIARSVTTDDPWRIALPLAVAYHQRASRSWAGGDALVALGDVDRAIALDPFFLAYRTTRAVLIDAMGRPGEAYRELDAFLLLVNAERRWDAAVHAWQTSRIQPKERSEQQAIARDEARRSTRELADASDDDLDKLLTFGALKHSLTDREIARAHASLGLMAFRLGRLEQAVLELRRAAELEPSAFHAHCLGAALYAHGDAAGAAQAEDRSVKLAPSNARYRWALIVSLRKLGRGAEAREHAKKLIEMAPDASAYRERIARIFGSDRG